MKIYTRTGDRGETSLFGGKRVPKDDLRIETYGTVDELNSVLGIIRAVKVAKYLDKILERIQNDLFVLGADLASPKGGKLKHSRIPRVETKNVAALERIIDRIQDVLPPLKVFILPAGSPAAAYLHHARAVCRRAERLAVRLARSESINPQILAYLNRLSDLLFVLARWVNKRGRMKEAPWERKVSHRSLQKV